MSNQKNGIWETDFNFIREQVNEWDPCSLMITGTPKDEYDSLTFKILSGLKNDKSDKELKGEVIDLLEDYYGLPVHSELEGKERAKLEEELEQLIEKVKKRPANNL